ncbi:BtpA/SgcQ family protein [Lentzea sp.]|uniref:BtpA/SgcQ family protein n=1 Tax=Lentzea sp. TaxID=56099 RepID=UPI002BE0511D|nr:BtpA/SgcQ family protein [Lentzea sp.]HUQ54087.1 BtpA/SgcQ family protein [Lentzea sp.]
MSESRKRVLGMIHLQPLPGTPFHEPGSLDRIVSTAVRSAKALENGGADGCLVQTVDRVYSVRDECDPARTAAMTLVVAAVVAATGAAFRTGVQIMRNAASASLAVAAVTGGAFVRIGALVGETRSPQGVVRPDPLALATYRKAVDASGVELVADVDTMHYSWLGGGKTAGEVAKAARTAGADAVAVSDPDEEAALRKVESVRACAPGLPVLLAGHTDHHNAARLLRAADGAFVGSCLESGGWGGEIDERRVAEYTAIVRSLS